MFEPVHELAARDRAQRERAAVAELRQEYLTKNKARAAEVAQIAQDEQMLRIAGMDAETETTP